MTSRQKFFPYTLFTLTVLVASVLFPAVASAQNQDAADDDRPNILFIMSDDHAAHAVGAYDGRLSELNPTPNLDRLAEEGMRMDNVFAGNSICVPARATFITGQYSHTHGLRTLAGGMPPKRQALFNEINDAGYNTAAIGKWHLKRKPAADYYAVLPGQGNYFNPLLRVKGNGEWPNNTRRFAGYNSLHSSDVITGQSLDWLKEQEEQDDPFFMYLGYKAPHDNFENAERHDWLYDDVHIPEPASLWLRGEHGPAGRDRYGTSIGRRNQRRNMGHHMHVPQDLNDRRYKRTAYQRYLKKYLRCVKAIDEGVGRVIDHLKQTGQLNNTVIFYTSDQGMMLGEHDYIDKRWMYEESIRMPFLVRYPERVEPGSSSDALIHNVDIAPTVLDLAGIDAPDSMEGRSMTPILTGNGTPDDWRDAIYYRYWFHMAHHDNPAHFGIRTKRYKLIFFYGLWLDARGGQKKHKPEDAYWELYDLKEDPNEQYNVYHDPAYRDVVKRLTRKLIEKKKAVGDTDAQYPRVRKRFRKTSIVDFSEKNLWD